MSVSTDRGDSVQAEAMLERAGLVRLCARLTGNVDAAEDLAQETLLEAWRNSYKLRDPQGRDRWLAAIARNVCRRWAREQVSSGFPETGGMNVEPSGAWSMLCIALCAGSPRTTSGSGRSGGLHARVGA